MKTLTLTLLILLTALPSLAGSLAISDNAGVLPPNQIETLRQTVSASPASLTVITGTFPNRNALNETVASCFGTTVCIAVDPSHHGTRATFGSDLHVPPSQLNAIAKAGDGFFRNGDFIGGVSNIFASAVSVAVLAPVPVQPVQVFTPQPIPVPAPVQVLPPVQVAPQVVAPAPVEQSSGHPFLIFLLVVAVIGGVVVVVRKMIAADSNYNAPSNPTSSKFDPSYRTPVRAQVSSVPAAAPTIINTHSNNDGLLGAVVGFEIGKSLNTPAPSHHHHSAPEPTYVPPAAPSGGSSDWGSGASPAPATDTGSGGSSDWGSSSSGSSGGSSDYGSSGGSSDYGSSGGGFDSGGSSGGGDSGGGSSW